jgi:hypothetical protein
MVMGSLSEERKKERKKSDDDPGERIIANGAYHETFLRQ